MLKFLSDRHCRQMRAPTAFLSIHPLIILWCTCIFWATVNVSKFVLPLHFCAFTRWLPCDAHAFEIPDVLNNLPHSNHPHLYLLFVPVARRCREAILDSRPDWNAILDLLAVSPSTMEWKRVSITENMYASGWLFEWNLQWILFKCSGSHTDFMRVCKYLLPIGTELGSRTNPSHYREEGAPPTRLIQQWIGSPEVQFSTDEEGGFGPWVAYIIFIPFLEGAFKAVYHHHRDGMIR